MNDSGNSSGFESQKQRDPWKQRRGARGVWIAVTFVVAAIVVTVAIIQGAYHRSSRNVPELPESRKVATTNAPSPAELSMSFREVAKSVKPTVVYVNIVENANVDSGQSDFFGFPGSGPRRREGAGSGFIVTEDGYILTNNHVVGNANKIKVTLSDGRRFDAEVVGSDAETDIAVIKINAGRMPIAVLGDSDNLEQGDWVLAIGSPFGLQQTLTAGIVSATGRELRESTYNHYIQTDASINPGNSGGPLVNMQGEVVGINTMILTGGPMSQGNIGIGFAIASNTARDIFKKLVREGRVSRGYLGVSVTNLDEASAHAVKLEPNAGVFVREVPDPDSPAGKAGIQPKDVITAFNGKPVRAARELTDTVAATPVGESARVDFIREGRPQSVTVQLVERPKNVNAREVPQDRGEGDSEGGTPQSGRLGIQGRTITPEAIDQMRLKLKVPTGVFVAAVQPGSAASDAGIMHGDVIHGVDGAAIKSVEELIQAVKALKPGDYLIEIERNRRTMFLTVTIE
ncbi:MAG TPA: trypsin-like peptidase domain-containing protein [Blastocatellia bacterium]|nr:trypsin-like peptidase domain-containing protein [Blastocatellia bacterium]